MSLKIFYLDDEPQLLEIFVDTFQDPQTHITTFQDPKDLFKALEASRPDIVFLDFRLPNITGVEIAKKLDPSLPKALVTGDLTVAHDNLFIAHFEKPMDPEAVLKLFQDLRTKAAA